LEEPNHGASCFITHLLAYLDHAVESSFIEGGDLLVVGWLWS